MTHSLTHPRLLPLLSLALLLLHLAHPQVATCPPA
jgi:hypothetical protein